jgi:sulfotransferase family protein
MNDTMARDETSPFFIVGNDRSGTTVLRLVLDRSHEAAVPSESMFLMDFASVRRRGGLDDPERAARFCATVWSHPKVRLWGLSGPPPEVPARLSHEEAYRFAVESPFRAYAAREGKERFGDKTPAYVHCLEEVFAVWPGARVVVLVRDARDVALSIMGLPFGPNNPYSAALWWSRGIQAGLAAARRRPHQVMTLSYEDLVTDPDSAVRRVCGHVGLGYDPEMLAIERSGPEKIVAEQAEWFTELAMPISEAGSGRFRTEMPAEEQRIVEAVAGDELRALGYETLDGSAAISVPRALGYRSHDAALRLANAVRLRLVEERGRELRHVVRRKLVGPRG